MEDEPGHIAVLQREALHALAVKPAGIYLDGTYGRGGHAGLILECLNSDGRLVAMDQDPDAIADGARRFPREHRFSLYKRNFEQLEVLAIETGIAGKIDGVLLDLGVSSPQLDTPERGFSFAQNGFLDMRMDPQHGESAADWIARVSLADLVTVLREYGDERYAKRIATAIIAARDSTSMTTTAALADVVKQAHPRWDHRRHPATKTFQAIRIHVNRELAVLQSALEQSARILKPGGRLAVISFHSLEDRIVKRFLRGTPADQRIPRHLPQPEAPVNPLKALGKKVPGDAEVAANPRARSAVLRIGERVV